MDRVHQVLVELWHFFEKWRAEGLARMEERARAMRAAEVTRLAETPVTPAAPAASAASAAPATAVSPAALPDTSHSATHDRSPAEIAAAASPPWGWREYQALVAPLPTPTAEQMQAFAEFVCGAHSWYKHLRSMPPGQTIRFYLDPSAGMQLSSQGGHVRAEWLEKWGFHYSQIPTADYRRRFGHLAFSQSSGSVVYRQGADGECQGAFDDVPAVYDPSTQSMRGLPSEVLHLGRARISGLVHRLGADAWRIAYEAVGRGTPKWPEESGGQQALADILERCHQMLTDPASVPRWNYPAESEPVLQRLVAPEVARQRKRMVEAMARVCAH